MQSLKETYEKISSYLLGELEGDALIAFETEIATDEKLRQEVELHREMAAHLTNTEEKDFIQNLSQLTKVKKLEKKPKSKTILWLGVLAILAILIFVGQKLIFDNSKSEPQILDKKQEPLVPSNDTLESQNKLQEIKETQKADQNTKPQQEKRIIPINQKQVEKPQILAMANFEPNKSLELLINGTTRGIKREFAVKEKIKDQDYVLDLPIKILFSGTIDTSSNLVDESITFYIFSNSKKAYDSFTPLNTSNPTLKKKDGGYEILVDKNVLLKPGLYYYILETSDDEELIYINKFSIQ